MPTMVRWVVPRTMESSTTTRRLPATLSRSGFSFRRTAVDLRLLVRVDEGPADVAVLDESLAVGDAAAAGVPLGRRHPRVRDAHHEIGVDRGLVGQQLAHPAPGAVDLASVQVFEGNLAIARRQEAIRPKRWNQRHICLSTHTYYISLA